MIEAIHHVQLAMPHGGEDVARDFYVGLLELQEIPKPDHLARRGGCWFTNGAVRIHLGVEPAFSPARKAHPALVVDDLAGWRRRFLDAGIPIVEDHPLPGFERFYVNDPFENRIAFLGASS